jgi:hypothetical protein
MSVQVIRLNVLATCKDSWHTSIRCSLANNNESGSDEHCLGQIVLTTCACGSLKLHALPMYGKLPESAPALVDHASMCSTRPMCYSTNDLKPSSLAIKQRGECFLSSTLAFWPPNSHTTNLKSGHILYITWRVAHRRNSGLDKCNTRTLRSGCAICFQSPLPVFISNSNSSSVV